MTQDDYIKNGDRLDNMKFIIRSGEDEETAIKREEEIYKERALKYLQLIKDFNDRIEYLIRDEDTDDVIEKLLLEEALDSRYLEDIEYVLDIKLDQTITNFFMKIERIKKTRKKMTIREKEKYIGEIYNSWKDFYREINILTKDKLTKK